MVAALDLSTATFQTAPSFLAAGPPTVSKTTADRLPRLLLFLVFGQFVDGASFSTGVFRQEPNTGVDAETRRRLCVYVSILKTARMRAWSSIPTRSSAVSRLGSPTAPLSRFSSGKILIELGDSVAR